MATWNADIPAVANTLAADLPDIEENFQELHDILEAITNGTLGTTEPANFKVDVGGTFVTDSIVIDDAANIGSASDTDAIAIAATGDVTLTQDLIVNGTSLVYVGDTANAGMTSGITINQGAADDEILAFKSSDVAHGLTAQAETDTYASFKKSGGDGGGLQIRSVLDGGETAHVAYMISGWSRDNVDTTKGTAGRALCEIFGAQHDGANNNANIVADGNIFALRAFKSGSSQSVFIVDEDGDYHYDGADGGAFDEFDDAQLIRAFSMVTSQKDAIKSQWDNFVNYNEQSLIDTGILGDTVENGGLVNGAQLDRLLVGNAWQGRLIDTAIVSALEMLVPNFNKELRTQLDEVGLNQINLLSPV